MLNETRRFLVVLREYLGERLGGGGAVGDDGLADGKQARVGGRRRVYEIDELLVADLAVPVEVDAHYELIYFGAAEGKVLLLKDLLESALFKSSLIVGPALEQALQASIALAPSGKFAELRRAKWMG